MHYYLVVSNGKVISKDVSELKIESSCHKEVPKEIFLQVKEGWIERSPGKYEPDKQMEIEFNKTTTRISNPAELRIDCKNLPDHERIFLLIIRRYPDTQVDFIAFGKKDLPWKKAIEFDKPGIYLFILRDVEGNSMMKELIVWP